MGDRVFLIKTEYDERPLSEAIESEVVELDKLTIYGWGSSAKDATE